ncbi:hypothetical protein Y032_0009g581 [Ancylostoma ceylanicum]|uniref:Uncharacterized protein n=1 Tax=Ancylostoma ceylanicum TaxID=53326 RepID=A0A016VIU9_9BILA|nr:hypothetical protein Y032_0009g581 [Ancylostoma ceylanicum]
MPRDGSKGVIRGRRRPKIGKRSETGPTERGLILHKECDSIYCGFLSYMLPFHPYTYFLIISFPTLCPFHSCLNGPPPPSCLYTPIDPYHFTHRANEGESACGDGRRPPLTDLSNFQAIAVSTWVNIDSHLPKVETDFPTNPLQKYLCRLRKRWPGTVLVRVKIKTRVEPLGLVTSYAVYY